MKKNLYIGGYSILDLSIANVYEQALICAKQNKPVLVYEPPLRYYADTIKIDTDNDDNVVITKGGRTITITDANSVSIVGEIQNHVYLHYINFDEIQGETSDSTTYDGYIHLNSPIISTKSTLTLKDVLDYLINENDYYQLGLTGMSDFKDLQYFEDYSESENDIEIVMFINDSQVIITFSKNNFTFDDKPIKLF